MSPSSPMPMRPVNAIATSPISGGVRFLPERPIYRSGDVGGPPAHLRRLPQRFHGSRPAEEIPLEGVAALAGEEVPLLRGLHPLGHDGQPDPRPQRRGA